MMLKSENVRAGRSLLEDSLLGLARKLNLASAAIKAKEGHQGLAVRLLSLTQRVRVGMAGWNKLSQLGVPYYVQYSDLCLQQLEQWASELQVLWDDWAKLSGEAQTRIARPKERMLEIARVPSLFSGASGLLWAMVALGVVGIAGYVVWRKV